MSTTATNYINLIRKNYPVRGRDNDSQGFRDNFTNIAEAIRFVNLDVEDLRNIAVLSNSTATFFGNTVEDANFLNCSTELWDNGTLSGNIVIDYTLGSYQKLTVASGVNNINLINLPGEGKSGNLILSITPALSGGTVINFQGSVIALGPRKNPYLLEVNKANIFELYSEYPAGGSNPVVYIRLLNELISDTGTQSTQIISERFVIRHPSNDDSRNHFYSIKSNTGTANATVVESTINGNPVSANLALNFNKIKGVTFDSTFANINLGLGDKLRLTSVTDLIVGAKFNVTTTNTTLIITDIDTTASTITFNPSIPAAPGLGQGTQIVFRNPTFGDYGEQTAFPTMVTLLDAEEYTPANSPFGRPGVFKGSVYANTSTLEVTFKDYGDGIQNTFTATIMPITTVTDKSLNLANTLFVHNILPAGSIIMWYGVDLSIPYGWGICDGTTYIDPVSNNSIKSPDLRNKFVVAADNSTVWNGADPTNSRVVTSSITGVNTSTGGRSDLALMQHSHLTTGTISSQPHDHTVTDPGHFHVLTNRAGVLATDARTPGGSDRGDRNCTEAATSELEKNSDPSTTGITVNSSTVIIDSFDITAMTTGTSVPLTNTDNIPPFYALYYIIKWAGA